VRERKGTIGGLDFGAYSCEVVPVSGGRMKYSQLQPKGRECAVWIDHLSLRKVKKRMTSVSPSCVRARLEIQP